jgi:hypothetical protein
MYLGSSVGSLCMTGFELYRETPAALDTGIVPNRNRAEETSNRDEAAVNPYHVLQIRRDATPSEIRQAYRRLSLWHHPGRKVDCAEERQRRLQVFEILAACYETLMGNESRRMLDGLLRDLEASRLNYTTRQRSGLPRGQMFVGGKLLPGKDDASPLLSKSKGLIACILTEAEAEEGDDAQHEHGHAEGIPNLSPASSHSSSSCEEQDPDRLMVLSCSPPASICDRSDDNYLPSLVNASTSGSDEVAEEHYSQAETDRLFGGPISLLCRARKWEPFTDAFVVFEQVFGTPLFQVDPHEIGRLTDWQPLRTTRSSAWTGSSETKPNGTTVFTTSRVLHNRRLTRTETIKVNHRTGLRNSVVTVTAEDLEEPMDHAGSNCLSCTGTGISCSSSPHCRNSEDDAICGNLFLMYDQAVQTIDEQFQYDMENLKSLFGMRRELFS